ncbi:hypothetical protein MMC26_006396 [Xylographa opegraphella]|nr:hypothetical protein [Xylographa opegraphella]
MPRATTHADDSAEEIEDDDIYPITDSCDQIRTKINTFINNGGMKVGEFQRAIGVTSTSYGNFMKKRGPYAGEGSIVYSAANTFFRKRELQGEKIPRKKAKKATNVDGKETGKNFDYDVSNIHFKGEDEGAVQIYDTCDEIRRKIAAHL